MKYGFGRPLGLPNLAFGYASSMDRPKAFAEHRFLGDKRTQVVYDLDAYGTAGVIDELMESEQFLCFAPDTLAEARNRGYRLARG